MLQAISLPSLQYVRDPFFGGGAFDYCITGWIDAVSRYSRDAVSVSNQALTDCAKRFNAYRQQSQS